MSKAISTSLLSVIIILLATCQAMAQGPIDCGGGVWMTPTIESKINIDGQQFVNCAAIIDLKLVESPIDITIKNSTFTNVDQAVLSGGSGAGANRLIIENSEFHNVTWAGSIRNCIAHAQIRGNRIDGATRGGFRFGKNDASIQSCVRNVHISDNEIRNVSAVSDATYGLIVYGTNVRIDGNTIENVQTTDTSQNDIDSAGVYCKCVAANIDTNSLLNAGSFEGGIVIKGGEAVSGNYARVTNNHVSYTDNRKVGGAIVAFESGVYASGNVVSGGDGPAIWVTGQGNDNALIIANQLTQTGGIKVQHCANCTISHNHIFDTQNHAVIEIAKSANVPATERLVIASNLIIGATSNDKTKGVWFDIASGGTVGDIAITSNLVSGLKYAADFKSGIPAGAVEFRYNDLRGTDGLRDAQAVTGLIYEGNIQ